MVGIRFIAKNRKTVKLSVFQDSPQQLSALIYEFSPAIISKKRCREWSLQK